MQRAAHRTAWRRVLSVTACAVSGLAWVLAGVPAVMAAPSETPVVEPAPADDIGAMWREANAKLATSDYPGAIAQLTRVYEAIAQDPEARMLRLRVRWALHEAHLGAHGVDDDPQHLYVARDLLRNGLADFGPDDGELRGRSETALAELDARIAELEQARHDREAAEQRRLADAAAAAREAEPTTTVPIEPPPPRPVHDEPPRPHRGLLAGGIASAGVGVIGLALLAGGFGSAARAVRSFETEPGSRDAARDDVRRGNAIGIAGAVIAGVALTTAAVLIPLALRRVQRSPRSVAHRATP